MSLEGVHRLIHERRAISQEQHPLHPTGSHQQIHQSDDRAGLACTGGHPQQCLALLPAFRPPLSQENAAAWCRRSATVLHTMNSGLQPFQYQGSKRVLASKILEHVPKGHFDEVLEPFAGSGAISLAAVAKALVSSIWLNDINAPLMDLWSAILSDTESLISEYAELWERQLSDPAQHFMRVRNEFNQSQRSPELLYLLARSVKGAVRYNSVGEFNQSPDHRRLGTRPSTTAARLRRISKLIGSRYTLTSLNCFDLIEYYREGQVWYLDPPYEGTSEGPNGRYFQSMPRAKVIEFLQTLLDMRIPFILSYDGFTGEKQHGSRLPDGLGLRHHFIDAGVSTSSSLQRRRETTTESLYISPELAFVGVSDVGPSHPQKSDASQMELGVHV